MVELILQPTRAANIAKLELSRSFHALYGCASLFGAKASKAEIMESQTKLRSHLNLLKKFTEEAQAEPSFWFTPFNASCYENLFRSLSQLADLLQFRGYAIGFLAEQGRWKSPQCKDILSDIDNDLKSLTQKHRSSSLIFRGSLFSNRSTPSKRRSSRTATLHGILSWGRHQTLVSHAPRASQRRF